MPGHLTDANPPSYNGYTFPNTVETVQFSGELVPDEADRTSLYVRYRIGLQWEVAVDDPSNNIDTTVADLKTRLMQRGGALVYSNRGFGASFVVNTNSVFDVNGGPKPIALDFKPKGKNRAATLTWTVEVCLPDQCTAIIGYRGVIMTFNYRLRVRIDRFGYSRRVYSGFFRIPKTAGIIQIADSFLENAMPPIPSGFDRVEKEFEHSYDKCRVDFTVVDEELTDNNLPPGCTAATASHFIRTTDSIFQWQGVIQGSYAVQRGTGVHVAISAFFRMVKDRLDRAREQLKTPDKDAAVDPKNPLEKNLIITGYSFGEPEIYGPNNVALEVTYTCVTSLQGIFDQDNFPDGRGAPCGLWQPVPDRDWPTWLQSVIQSARATRGNAGLFLQTGDDAIVDLCSNVNPVLPSGGEVGYVPGGIAGEIDDLQPEPDPETSYLIYDPEIQITEESHGITSTALPDQDVSPGSPGGGGSPGDWPYGIDGYQVDDNKPGEPTDFVQYRAPGTLIIYFSGRALRAWYPIPRPKLLSYRGLEVKEVSQEEYGCFWRQKQVAQLGIGLPLYYAEWSFRYVVEARPSGGIKPPPGSNDLD